MKSKGAGRGCGVPTDMIQIARNTQATIQATIKTIKMTGSIMIVGVRMMKEEVTFVIETASLILLQQQSATRAKNPPTAHMAYAPYYI
jgi:hypothetical protein